MIWESFDNETCDRYFFFKYECRFHKKNLSYCIEIERNEHISHAKSCQKEAKLNKVNPNLISIIIGLQNNCNSTFWGGKFYCPLLASTLPTIIYESVLWWNSFKNFFLHSIFFLRYDPACLCYTHTNLHFNIFMMNSIIRKKYSSLYRKLVYLRTFFFSRQEAIRDGAT